MTIVLANAFAGTLFSFLSVEKLEPIINSLQELAISKEVKLVIQDRTELAIRFLVVRRLLILNAFNLNNCIHFVWVIQ